LIELIRNKIILLLHLKWIRHFGWVKVHAGIEGNELVDRLAKEAAVEDEPVVYDKMAREGIKMREKEVDFIYGNGSGRIRGREAVTRASFLSVRNRLRQKIPIIPEFITMLTRQGKLRSYLDRFGLTENSMSPCEEEQTTDHLIFQCKKWRIGRNEIIKQIRNTGGNWPTTNETLINNYLQIFVKFFKSTDFKDLK